MAITNLYPNLPGHLVEFKDGGLTLTENKITSSDKSILILGTAFDGPVNEPVQIDDTSVAKLFGPEVDENGYPNGATLTKYARQAFKNGFNDVRCMRVTGSQASVTINKTSVSSVETIEASAVATVEGNALATHTLAHLPIDTSSLLVKKGSTALGVGVNPFDGILTIAANSVTKNSTLKVEYNYYDVDPALKTETNIDVSSDGINFDTIDLTPSGLNLYDPSIGEKIYSCMEVGGPSTNPATLTAPLNSTGLIVRIVGGASLVEGTDYAISNGIITILPGGSVTTSDKVEVEFYKYKLESVAAPSEEVFSLHDVDQTISLSNTPSGPVTITINGLSTASPSDYSVAGNIITLTAGAFNKDDVITINYSYEKENTITEGMTVRSIYGGSVYKEASVSISEYEQDGVVGRKFTFTKPTSKLYSASDLPFYFTSFEYPTVGQLRDALASYALNNVFEIICDDEDVTTEDFPLFSGQLTDGGEDGVKLEPGDGYTSFNDKMYEALSGVRWKSSDVAAPGTALTEDTCTPEQVGFLRKQGAYQILENYNVDYIYPAGIYADSKQSINKYSNFHQELALLCAVLTYRTKMTHGFIDVKPNSNTTLVGIQKHVDKLLAYDNTHYMKDNEGNEIVDSEGNKMDIGWYTSIVVGPEPVIISDTLGRYYGSPAIAYAALNASIKPESAPTNKALPGVSGMKYKFSNKQMDALIGNRMVVFKLKNEGTTTASSTPYVVDGCTAGMPNSDYTRLSTVKIVTDVVDQIREVADPFIGEPNTIEQRNALSALISKRLSYLMEQGEIQYYEFEVNATIQQVLLGECSIALTLVCPMELRKITTVVALRAAA